MDLSKGDKKIAREIIDRGLIVEFEEGMEKFDQIMDSWRAGKTETKDAYYDLFQSVKDFDKNISYRYDGLSGSRYFQTVVDLLVDKKIPESEINRFRPEVQERYYHLIKPFGED